MRKQLRIRRFTGGCTAQFLHQGETMEPGNQTVRSEYDHGSVKTVKVLMNERRLGRQNILQIKNVFQPIGKQSFRSRTDSGKIGEKILWKIPELPGTKLTFLLSP
jgi:hypothetical protein